VTRLPIFISIITSTVPGSLDGGVEKDGTFYVTKDATKLEASSPFFCLTNPTQALWSHSGQKTVLCLGLFVFSNIKHKQQNNLVSVQGHFGRIPLLSYLKGA
jgi:hypothetical protein